MFESSVILEGSKTAGFAVATPPTFESSVILEGSKTRGRSGSQDVSLRVVLF